MKVAVYQARTGINAARNAERLATVVREAAAGGAVMVFTPEMSGLLDRSGERADVSIVTEEQDDVLRVVREAAAAQGIWVHLGSLALRRPDGRLANRSFVLDDAGAVRARYDKMHLFDVDLPTGESWRESARYVGGEAAVAVDTPLGRLGLSVCYDLRFPALYAALEEAGSTLLAVPAAFTVPTGTAHWHILCRARAIENGATVIAAAQCGHHEDGRRTFGHSLVVDAWGEVLLDLGEEEDAVGFADIDPATLERARTALPVARHGHPIAKAHVES